MEQIVYGMMTNIYVMQSGDYIKIGISDKPHVRLKQIRGHNPHNVELKFEQEIFKSRCFAVERYAHDLLKPHRSEYEWFKCHPNDGIEAVKSAIDHANVDAGIRINDDTPCFIGTGRSMYRR